MQQSNPAIRASACCTQVLGRSFYDGGQRTRVMTQDTQMRLQQPSSGKLRQAPQHKTAVAAPVARAHLQQFG